MVMAKKTKSGRCVGTSVWGMIRIAIYENSRDDSSDGLGVTFINNVDTNTFAFFVYLLSRNSFKIFGGVLICPNTFLADCYCQKQMQCEMCDNYFPCITHYTFIHQEAVLRHMLIFEG